MHVARLLPLLFVVACARTSDMTSCRLVGTWRPVPTPQEEADIRILARHACSGPIDVAAAMERALSAFTVSFVASGEWSTKGARELGIAPQHWKQIAVEGDTHRVWLSESPEGPDRTVSCELTPSGELIVRDGMAWFTRFERVR